MRATLPHSIRGRLIALTLALLLPAVVVTSVLLWRAYAQEHDAAEGQLSDTARALSLVVDRQIGQSAVLLDALATSNRLKSGDFAAFDAQARAANSDPARWVAVIDPNGRQLINTRATPGAVLPVSHSTGHSHPFSRLHDGTRLSYIVKGAFVGAPIMVLSRDVRLRDGRLVDLSVANRADSLATLFQDQHLPDRWTGVILDSDYRIVARNRGNDLYAGHQASPATRKRIQDHASGVKPTTTLDGIPSITAWNRSTVTGWTMFIAVPRTELAAGARSSLIAGAALGLVLLGIGLLVSYRVGRSVALPVQRLSSVAAALGRGDEIDAYHSPLVEIAAVEDALREAGAALRARERDLQALNNNLELRVMERTRELAEAAESLIQAQKMEAVGRLTGGIAHDFNNLLTAVLGNIELLQRTAEDDRAKRLLGSARQAAERGAKLTGQLLAFSRRQQLRAEAVDISRAIENTVELLKSTLGGATGIIRVPSADLWPARADPTQLDLILLNLAINARDAMPAGGSILIETANVTIGEAPRSAEEPPPGDFVSITLADRGTGMTPEVLARVFDPFFTTKPVGQGTGLGLPQVLGVLKQLGGGIRIRSRVGEGTSVTIFLPRSAVEQPAEGEVATDEAGDLRGMKVLLVDDDPDVRGVAAAILREVGASVDEAESGRLGIARLTENPDVDLALIDFAMPGMTGAEAAVAMRAQMPDLPILLMSGYADVEALASVWDGPLISKPFTAGSLQARIAEAVRRHRAARLKANG